MTCDSYYFDIFAIEPYISKIKDASIKEQVRKKLKKVLENPSIGETKSYNLTGIRAVKVNKQKIVILYKIDEKDPCKVVFVDIGSHEDVYSLTF
ncbi:MAG: type II toxin-antitoxin system RelE/ParE family toxin [Candidatus Thermoplasmatota archaeon]|jgi:mRNA-degrading endonuclease RelE of RelBE toxin-antitoxin system|nr:type II toxin-antitoxin system RelE/ParE family toxin [Candidatus Thermoplasmatota archaeon]